MSYSGRLLGQLLHAAVERDAVELAKAVMPDSVPWPAGTEFSVQHLEGGGRLYTAKGPGVNISRNTPFNRQARDVCVLVWVDAKTGEVSAKPDFTVEKPISCGYLERPLSYFFESWAEADMHVTCNEMYGDALWYLEDLRAYLLDKMERLDQVGPIVEKVRSA